MTYIAGYILIYLLLRLWLKNVLISIFGIFLIILQNYFVQIGNLNPGVCPQVGFLRFGWFIPVMFLVLLRTRLARGERSHLRCILRSGELLFVAIAFFWVADAGSYVLGAYIVTIFVEEFYNQSGFNSKIKTFLFRMAEIMATLILLFAVISIFTFIRSHQWPDWYGYVQSSLLYVAGFGMMPMPATGLYVLFVAVYLSSASYVVVKLFFAGGKAERDLPIIAFVTAYGILQFVYYVGRSHPNNLHHVVIPFIMVICWFMLKGLGFALSSDGRAFLHRNVLMVSSISLVIILLLSPPILLSTKQMIAKVANRGNIIALMNSRDDLNRLIPDTDEQSKFMDSVKAIEEIEKGREKVALISGNDAFFLVETNRTNYMNSNNLTEFILMSQLEELASQLLNARPTSVYIDSNPSQPEVKYLKDMIQDDYYFVENHGLLDRYVLR